MAQRALDIEELENMLNASESDEKLSAQAIKICVRLQLQILLARHGSRQLCANDLELERQDFERVIAEIWRRRSKEVLNDYIAHVQSRGGPLDG